MFKFNPARLPPPLIALIVIIVFFVFSLPLKSSIFSLFFLPLEITSSFIADTKAVLTYKFILEENIRLKKEISRSKSDSLMVTELQLENERLKKFLSLKDNYQFKTAAARVIARDPDNWSAGIIINKGSKQGITPGKLVINDEGLLGRIVEVSGDSSKIMLVNDPDSAVGAFIQRTREEGLVLGTLLGGLVMRYLDKDSDIIPGDIVLASGINQELPSGVLIGSIEAVKDDDQGLGKYCPVKTAVNLKRIREVLVIVGK